MKALIKKKIPRTWQFLRIKFSNLRRFVKHIKFLLEMGISADTFILFRMINLVRPEYTMLRPMRLKLLYDLSINIKNNNIKGNIIECGVYQGGASVIMSYPHKNDIRTGERKVYLFDSFEGNPKPTKKDGEEMNSIYYSGFAKGKIEKVKEIFKKYSLLSDNIHIVKGWFDDTLQSYQDEPVALLHIDANLYSSTKICLERFYDLVELGGYIVFDDYGTRAEGCTKAIDDFFEDRNIKPNLKTYDNYSSFHKKELTG